MRADALDYALAAVCPAVSLDEADTVRADLLLRDIILVAAGSAGTIVGWILLGLAAAQGFGAFIDADAVPGGVLILSYIFVPP